MRITTLIFFLVITGSVFSQTAIEFFNPSFEDTPGPSKTPLGWYNCGVLGESPPDIHPIDHFSVEKEPFDGRSFIAMVTRDNGTTEAVGQRLKQKLLADTTYAFGIYLTQSEHYVSFSRSTKEEVDFITPCVLSVWGGNDICEKKELLYKTAAVDHNDWKLYNIIFTPQEDYRFLTFESYYDDPTLSASNGNLLLDNIVTNDSLLVIEGETSITKEDVYALESMIEFSRYVKKNKLHVFYEIKTAEEIRILATAFLRFEMYESASAIYQLSEVKMRPILSTEDYSDNYITDLMFKVSESNSKKLDINQRLKNDNFDKKINDYTKKNKTALELLQDR